MVLRGYVAFLDPPKESTRLALAALEKHGVHCKVLTGDNDIVAKKICNDVGLPISKVLLGHDIEAADDAALDKLVESATLFARLSPAHKERVVRALQRNGHVVGFMGDGINDAPALRAADVGISVDNAVDIAKESADLILLEKDLLVLEHGVVEGPPRLRQHRQIYKDGHQLQLWKHVLGAGGERVLCHFYRCCRSSFSPKTCSMIFPSSRSPSIGSTTNICSSRGSGKSMISAASCSSSDRSALFSTLRPSR